jgi:hypothetical protein
VSPEAVLVDCPRCDIRTDVADLDANGSVRHDGHVLVLLTTRMGRTVRYVISGIHPRRGVER